MEINNQIISYYIIWNKKFGVSPSGKAVDFDSAIRRFESCHPSYFKILSGFNNKKLFLIYINDATKIK